MKHMSSFRLRGFTLLEVLVAIAILGLGLSVILSSQVGLFSSAARTDTLSQVTGLARCKMGDIEVKLDKDGYPMADEDDEGPCCGDDDEEGLSRYTCSWKIQTVELPDANAMSGEGDGGVSGGQGDLGPIAALAGLQQSGGASLGPDAGLGALANLMGGQQSGSSGTGASGAGAMGGIAGMVMGMVYPQLKPMLEASIRKVTVTVHWKEGLNERKFSVEQYVTNPRQGGLDPNVDDNPQNSTTGGGNQLGSPGSKALPTSPFRGLLGGATP